MIESSYPYGELFQLRLAALLLRYPKKVRKIVEPRFFTNPMLVDIARILRDVYKKHPDSRVSRTTLRELVRQSLGPKGDEVWPSYKKIIRKIYRTKLPDRSLLLDHAKAFAKESRYRATLVKAEREISVGRYDSVHKLLEKLRAEDAADGDNLSKWEDLPRYQDFPPKEVDWLVEGFVPAESILALSGDEGAGKTILNLWLAKSLTEGTDFMGRRVSQTRVLYLGLDVSQITLQSYIRMMRWEPNKYFRIMTMWTGDNHQPPMLDDPVQMEKLYAIAREKRVVIIFDTLRDFFDGEENSSTDTKPVLDAVRKLRALGATVILIVHPPKRGHSAIRGTGNISQKVDIPYSMEKEKWGGKDVVVLSCPKKNRFGSTHFQLPLRQLFIPTPAGPRFVIFEVTDWKPSKELKKDDRKIEVMQYVKDHPGTNQKDIQEALGMGYHSVKKYLSAAEGEGLIKSGSGAGKERCWYGEESEEDAVDEDALKT